jgi:alkanesulfonate monooxygenase SsuD/methylene tetrahydromethanopterin reductase-like flavin-dependent oxidoreductase (luciferase family)
MKYAIYLPIFTPYASPRVLADLALEAEQAGWDGFFIWDDVASYDTNLTDPWIGLAAAAVNTSRIRLGVLVTPLARRRPWKVARETVALDQLSGGRMVVGVGTGGGDEQFGDLGDENNPRLRGEMLDEGLEILTGLWSGLPYRFEGKHYHIRKARFQPGPLQQPRIPIWVGGVWPHKRPLERMARWDGMFQISFDLPDRAEELRRLRESIWIVQAMRSPQAGPLEVVVTGITPFHDLQQGQEITAAYAQAGATWWLESIAPLRDGDPSRTPLPFEKLRERVLEGPPRF